MEEAQSGENIVGKIKQDLEREDINFVFPNISA